MKNPTIKINNVGKRMFNFSVKIPVSEKEYSEYKGVGTIGHEIEIDITKKENEKL